MEVTNRFKRLELIDRVPEELWTEVCDIVQEVGIKTIPKKKRSKKAKWLSEEVRRLLEEGVYYAQMFQGKTQNCLSV